jgi:hypothetical protein
MLKYTLLGCAMMMTVPALAQTAPAAQTNTPAATQAAPATAPAPAPAPAAPSAAPLAGTAQTQAAPADASATAAGGATAATQTAATQPAGPEQVAQLVDTQFGTYDTNADGKLSPTEFGAWMVALKSQSDPKTDANSPETKTWNQAAFAQADTDKNKTLSKTEIAGFLAPAKS